jgi:DNA (cytosine-5)-methyltransferase 1
MEKLKVLDLFSGIGGFSLGLERTGEFETVAFCEIEKFPQKVLAKHWPGVPIYEDVRELTAERLKADGTRSGLWSECARLVGELRPDYAIFENVTALLAGESGKWFERVLWDISALGYDAEWHCIPASTVGASHKRDRVWIITYPNSKFGVQCIKKQILRKSHLQGQSGRGFERFRERPSKAEAFFCREDDGVPSRVDRLKGLGNAVVPQIPKLIGRSILENRKNHAL